MSSSKTVRLCLVSWLRSQKSTKPKLCKSLACASSTKSKPLGNHWKIFDSLISLVDFSDLKVWHQRRTSYKKKAIWFDNNCWERKKNWMYRSSSCVAIGQSASLVARLTCWWPPKPDSTIKKGNKCRELTCQDVFSQWASQTSMNNHTFDDWNQRMQRGLPNLWWTTEDLLPQLWELTHQLGFRVFTQPGQPHALNQQISEHFPTMTLKNKGKHKHDFKLMHSKFVCIPSITCGFFDGKQSPPATCICQIVLLILNWKVHTVAGKKPLPPNKDVNGVKFPLALIHLHSLHLCNTVSARKRRDSQCKCHCNGPERKGAVTSTRASEFPNHILRGQWESQSPNGSKKHWNNQKQFLLLQALAHVQGSRVIYLVLAFQLVIKSLSYTLSMKLHVLPSHL